MPVRIKNIHKTSNGINRHPQEIASDSLPQCEFQVLSLFKELDPKHQEELLIQITALVRFLHTKNMAPQVSQFLFR